MIFLGVILLTCVVNLGGSVTVELYSGQNYSGSLRKVVLSELDEVYCIQMDKTYEVRSLKTEKCIMVYETEDCKRIDAPAEGSKMYSVRVERDTALFDIDGAYSNRKDERGVQSFQLCGNEPGAGLLNVTIYSGPSYTGDLVASYEGVCECKNIPSYLSNVLRGKPFSIDNHGKNMYFYDKEDCTGQERLIPAGDNERSRSVFHLDTRAVVIRSFRLADSLPCPKLDASVYKFTISNEKYSSRVRQNTTHTMINRERTTVTEYINLDDWYAAEYTVAKPFTYIHITLVKAGFLMETHSAITSWLRNALQSSLEAHYRYPNTNQNTAIIVTRPMHGVLSKMPVQKSRCTTCTVNSSVRKFKYLISYTAEAVVTGMSGKDKMSAKQIRHFLPPGMKYVKDHDDYSVVVTVEGEMKGSLDRYDGPETSCTPLPDCESSLRVDL